MPSHSVSCTFLAFIFFYIPTAIAGSADEIAVSAGIFEVTKEEVTQYGIEYRGAPRDSFYNIRPAVGIEVNDDGGYWVYGGIRYDFNLNNDWDLTPHAAVSWYEAGDSNDLGGELQFRSGLDLSFRLNELSRIGLGVTHLSNAGANEKNPGANSVFITYSVKVDIF
ncbi:acyloxyacyl hydrolase [Amphritea balenae]|uniref:Acyloxyacyl hydrolase n=1 Tax=Amphritea balenae TaxID=452629 RepID=A0A3P1SQ73_9GAMM|nr:acyloxyacyl hydrolase [Amphritea balenae]RRC99273.1 acyloxyacyl hydrolase [Amphritea balenae]GGK72484.1 hypothetical protein GCM10007941_23170 [Amphritea balenae]